MARALAISAIDAGSGVLTGGPPGVSPPGVLPPGVLPPPGVFPPGVLPPGVLPPGVFPLGVVFPVVVSLLHDVDPLVEVPLDDDDPVVVSVHGIELSDLLPPTMFGMLLPGEFTVMTGGADVDVPGVDIPGVVTPVGVDGAVGPVPAGVVLATRIGVLGPPGEPLKPGPMKPAPGPP